MVWILVFAVVAVLGLVGWRVALRMQKAIDAHPHDYEISRTYPRAWLAGAGVFGVLTLFVVVANSIVSVPTKDVGVETTYGKWLPQSEITGETLRNVRTLAAAVARLLHEG